MEDRSIVAILGVLYFINTSLADTLFRYNIEPGPSLTKHKTYLEFPHEATRNGYLSEVHYVTTEDGYILTIFRLRDPRCTSLFKVPVLTLHGFLVNSDFYIVAGKDAALGYLLAKSCFDVWACNSRGTNYGRNHTTLNPDKDATFWDFGTDELALYDNPATIDYVRTATSSEKVNVIGFSQGGASILFTLAERPEYNSKVGVVIGLATAAIVKNMKSIPFRLTSKICELFQDMFSKIGISEILSKGSLIQSTLEFLCQFGFMKPVCKIILALFDNSNPGSLTEETYAKVFSKLFMGISVKLAISYQQKLKAKLPMKYDYGTDKNLAIYGSETPPLYELKNVTAPVMLLTGLRDNIILAENVKEIGTHLPNLIKTVIVQDRNWNHFDMLISKNIPRFTYPIIEECLKVFT